VRASPWLAELRREAGGSSGDDHLLPIPLGSVIKQLAYLTQRRKAVSTFAPLQLGDWALNGLSKLFPSHSLLDFHCNVCA
jgi:hypothetical protein